MMRRGETGVDLRLLLKLPRGWRDWAPDDVGSPRRRDEGSRRRDETQLRGPRAPIQLDFLGRSRGWRHP